MSVRSVDVQTMIPRLTENSRQQQNAEAAPFVAQHALTAQSHERAVRRQHQVNHKAPADQAAVRRDREGDGKQGGGREPQERPQRKEPETKAKSQRQWGNRLDVRI